MTEVFVDTGFWVATINPKDNLHEQAKALAAKYNTYRWVTTDAVLIEFQNFFSEYGPELRKLAGHFVTTIENDPNVTVLPQMRDTLKAARTLYSSRLDKGYSLTDCYSMVVMKQREIHEVLTYDEHFVQERFRALMR